MSENMNLDVDSLLQAVGIDTHVSSKHDDIIENVAEQIQNNEKDILYYQTWLERFSELMTKDSHRVLADGRKSDMGLDPIDYTKEIRVAPTDDEIEQLIKSLEDEIYQIERNNSPEEATRKKLALFKDKLKPAKVLAFPTPPAITIGGKKIPIWQNTTKYGINLRLGFQDGDTTKATPLVLADDNVHAQLGGITGSGKSVTLNDITVNLLVEYPPWELMFSMCDFKFVELSRYATPPAPHVNVIGATDSTEYISSLFDHLSKLMKRRQRIFMALGVQNIKEFRSEYKMVMPRQLLLVDEFAQLFLNLKQAEDDEGRKVINNVISELARLGRNAGFHMLLSSQDLSDSLADEADKQFSLGISLKANVNVSNKLIGNEEASKIPGKGLAYANKSRLEPNNTSKNIKFRTPFIPSEISSAEENAYLQAKERALASGQPEPPQPLPYLKQILVQLRNLADSFNWDRDLAFFDQNADVAYDIFKDDISFAYDEYTTPHTGNAVLDKYEKLELFANIAVGWTTRYKIGSQLEYISIYRKQRNNIFIAGRRDEDIIYMMNVLISNLNKYNAKHYIVQGTPSLAELSGIANTVENAVIYRRPVVPQSFIDRFKTRKELLDVQLQILDYLADNEEEGYWHSSFALAEYIKTHFPKIEVNRTIIGDLASVIDNMINKGCLDVTQEDMDQVKEVLEKYPDFEYEEEYADLFQDFYYDIVCLLYDLTGFSRPLSTDMFSAECLWLIGMEEMTDINDNENYDLRTVLKEVLTDAPKYNMFVIATSKIVTPRTEPYMEFFNYVFDKCDKTMQADLALKVKKDMLEPTMQNFISVQNRQDKMKYITVKKYKRG